RHFLVMAVGGKGPRGRYDRSRYASVACGRGDFGEGTCRDFFAGALAAVVWGDAAGAVPRDPPRGAGQPQNTEQHSDRIGQGPRGAVAGAKPGRAEDISRSFGGDD